MLEWIDVLLLPTPGEWPPADAIAVVDVLRATSTVAMLVHHGARSVVAVADEQLARTIAKREQALLAGEIGGLPPPGFDLGNSPVAVDPGLVRGRDVVLFTTNGTRALCIAAQSGRTAAVAVVNVTAAIAWLAHSERVLLVCAGERGGTGFALEDFAVAAHIAQGLLERHPGAVVGDGARLAMSLREPITLATRSDHAHVLRALGLGADVDFALRADVVESVPVVVAHGNGWARLRASPA